jgi:hypothetical protein
MFDVVLDNLDYGGMRCICFLEKSEGKQEGKVFNTNSAVKGQSNMPSPFLQRQNGVLERESLADHMLGSKQTNISTIILLARR